MPVVWCSDPNSNSKKPTAFALQGIQLQGNLSEQHVLAVRELISAAAEGRLLLPSDGGIVLLDCGVGVGSVIIQDSYNPEQESNKENVAGVVQQKPELHNIDNGVTRKEFTEFGHLKNEILYEFLCCARCTNEERKCCNRKDQSKKLVEKYIDSKLISTGRGNKRPGSAMRPISARRKNIVSFKSDKRPLRRVQASGNGNKMPIYATVNKQLKQKNRKQPQIDHPEPSKNTVNDVIESNNLLSTARKTSFDSTCTVSSMDSGFMEMQSKLENAKNAAKTQCSVTIQVDPSEETDMVDSSEKMPGNWSRLTIPSQSRNRRKSYEEFKSLFNDHPKNSSVTDENRLNVKSSSVKSRRKSYEEFKSATNLSCDNNSKPSSSNEVAIDSFNLRADESSIGKMKRKNSKRISTRKNKFNNSSVSQSISEDSNSAANVTSSTIYDILSKHKSSAATADTKHNYDKNLELFKSHCNKNNIKDFDNLLSCGTIYDIIQRKNDLFTKNFKRYDKYMTYGTLYEILHRKTDEDEQFERKRTLSEKFTNKRINYAQINFKSPADDKSSAKAVDTSAENLNSTSTTSASSMKQGSVGVNNQLSITSIGSQQLSTIYDILQTKKLETSPVNLKGCNRFLVKKITEEDLIEAAKKSEDQKSLDETAKLAEIPQSKPISEQTSKMTNRIRRFSNILSYNPKSSNENDKLLKIPVLEADKRTNVHLEAKIDELYSRLNRITQQNESSLVPVESEPNRIYKSSSLDMLATLNENEGIATRQKHFRKVSVPVLHPIKQQPKKSRRLSEFTRGEFLNEKL